MHPFAKFLIFLFLLAAAVTVGSQSPAFASPEQDQALYDGMYEQGVVLFPAAYSQARRACGVMYQGASPEAVVTTFEQINPNWTHAQASAFVVLTVQIYCPVTAPSKGGSIV